MQVHPTLGGGGGGGGGGGAFPSKWLKHNFLTLEYQKTILHTTMGDPLYAGPVGRSFINFCNCLHVELYIPMIC